MKPQNKTKIKKKKIALCFNKRIWFRISFLHFFVTLTEKEKIFADPGFFLWNNLLTFKI